MDAIRHLLRRGRVPLVWALLLAVSALALGLPVPASAQTSAPAVAAPAPHSGGEASLKLPDLARPASWA